MTAALGQLRLTIATLIKGFAPGTALQMLHDAAADACLNFQGFDLDWLTPEQGDVVRRDLERTLGEIGAASIEPAERWNEAHPNEPEVWPTMVMGDGAAGKRCQFYRSDLMENPDAREEWFDQAGLEGLGAVDLETLAHAHEIVERGEPAIAALEVVRAPADWLLGSGRIDRAASAILNVVASATGSHELRDAAQRATRSAEASEPGGDAYDCTDEPLGGLFACALGDRAPALWGVAGAVGSLAVMGMLPVSWWVRLMGAAVGGAGVFAVMRRGAA